MTAACLAIGVIPFVVLFMANTYAAMLGRAEAVERGRVENVRGTKRVGRLDPDVKGEGKEIWEQGLSDRELWERWKGLNFGRDALMSSAGLVGLWGCIL